MVEGYVEEVGAGWRGGRYVYIEGQRERVESLVRMYRIVSEQGGLTLSPN